MTRQNALRRLLWGLIGGALVIAVAIDRWLSGAHYVSDIVGGILLAFPLRRCRCWWPDEGAGSPLSWSLTSYAARRRQAFRCRRNVAR